MHSHTIINLDDIVISPTNPGASSIAAFKSKLENFQQEVLECQIKFNQANEQFTQSPHIIAQLSLRDAQKNLGYLKNRIMAYMDFPPELQLKLQSMKMNNEAYQQALTQVLNAFQILINACSSHVSQQENSSSNNKRSYV